MHLIKEELIECDINAFYRAVHLTIDTPGIIKKGICGCEVIKWGVLKNFDEGKLHERVEDSRFTDLSWIWEECQERTGDFRELSLEDTHEKVSTVVLTKIIFKQAKHGNTYMNVSIINQKDNSVTFCRYDDFKTAKSLPPFPYKLVYDRNCLSLFMPEGDFDYIDTWKYWLENMFLTKVVKIIQFDDRYQAYADKYKNVTRVIDKTEYYPLYSELKQKYAASIIENWTEVTDPQKFVYEDLAIATYLILLWRKYSSAPQKFVDLGCGNGLLVHILCQEGHFGTGIDVRKRKIWDVYPKCDRLVLKEETITPSDSYLFPDTDWIIGNHSDELSPWIPVIAARSSYDTKFFLLPCCAYDFNGQKYQRSNSNQSVYEDFLEYVTHISKVCGFNTESERLAIPSTKRIAVIGATRSYDQQKYLEYEQKIQKFISARSNCSRTTTNAWVSEFKPREAIERVRNCTTINKQISYDIALKVFRELLTKKQFVPEYPTWNIGGTLSLCSVVNLLTNEERQVMKEEAGGLQTLLKNHSSVFKIHSGNVCIKTPLKFLGAKDGKLSKTEKNRKKAPCWFVQNHPDGCPLSDEDCNYKHEIQEKE